MKNLCNEDDLKTSMFWLGPSNWATCCRLILWSKECSFEMFKTIFQADSVKAVEVCRIKGLEKVRTINVNSYCSFFFLKYVHSLIFRSGNLAKTIVNQFFFFLFVYSTFWAQTTTTKASYDVGDCKCDMCARIDCVVTKWTVARPVAIHPT